VIDIVAIAILCDFFCAAALENTTIHIFLCDHDVIILAQPLARMTIVVSSGNGRVAVKTIKPNSRMFILKYI